MNNLYLYSKCCQTYFSLANGALKLPGDSQAIWLYQKTFIVKSIFFTIYLVLRKVYWEYWTFNRNSKIVPSLNGDRFPPPLPPVELLQDR